MGEPLHLAFVKFTKDSYIFIEGQKNSDRFFIIRSGNVKISSKAPIVAEEQGAVLGPGDFIGLVSAMSNHNRIETAQALTDVVLISVQREQFSQFIHDNEAVAMKIILQFSKRMRYLDEALIKHKDNSIIEDPSHLYNIGEYYSKKNMLAQALYAYKKYVNCHPNGMNAGAAVEKINKIIPNIKNPPKEYTHEDTIRNYIKDEIIFCEGEPGEELFVIQKGSVKIIKFVDNNEILLATLKAGDIFGEMALLESKPRAAGAVACDNCQLMAISHENFQHIISSQPKLIARLTIILSERIWLLYKRRFIDVPFQPNKTE